MALADRVSSTTTELRKLSAPENDNVPSSPVQAHDSTYDADLLDEFAGMDEDCLLGEATVVKGSKQAQQHPILEPPALPQKSSLRASRVFDTLKLNSIQTATKSLTTPHDAYMSSEEDASSAADEFSDYDYDSCSEVSSGSPTRRKSYEDTAKIVSVVFSGKPCLVNLPSPRRSTMSSSSSGSDSNSTHESSVTTPSGSSVSLESHPARTSSLAAPTVPSFLKNDPYATSHYTLDSTKEDGPQESPRKAPAMLGRVSRTLSLVRKRSRPFIRTTNSYADEVTPPSPHVSTINLPQLATVALERATESVASPAESIDSVRSPVRYNDIIKSAKRHASARGSTISLQSNSAPSPTVPKKSLLSSLKHSRRKSMKA